MVGKSYLNFDLLIEHANGGYRARVLNSPAGQAEVNFSLPFTKPEMGDFLSSIGRVPQGDRNLKSSGMEIVKTFGGRLFEAVFSGEIKKSGSLSTGRGGTGGTGRKKRFLVQLVLSVFGLIALLFGSHQIPLSQPYQVHAKTEAFSAIVPAPQPVFLNIDAPKIALTDFDSVLFQAKNISVTQAHPRLVGRPIASGDEKSPIVFKSLDNRIAALEIESPTASISHLSSRGPLICKLFVEGNRLECQLSADSIWVELNWGSEGRAELRHASLSVLTAGPQRRNSAYSANFEFCAFDYLTNDFLVASNILHCDGKPLRILFLGFNPDSAVTIMLEPLENIRNPMFTYQGTVEKVGESALQSVELIDRRGLPTMLPDFKLKDKYWVLQPQQGWNVASMNFKPNESMLELNMQGSFKVNPFSGKSDYTLFLKLKEDPLLPTIVTLLVLMISNLSALMELWRFTMKR